MAPPEVGDVAPDFSLAPEPGPRRVSLEGLRGEPVVLLFFPLAFSSVCTVELERVADDWSRWQETGTRVFGISVDSPFVLKRLAEEHGLPFTLLSDFNREAGAAYDVLYEDFFGLHRVSKRAAFVIDRAGKLAYAWVTDDAAVLPPFDEVLEVVGTL